MNTIEAIYKRRAVKAFDAAHKLSADEERTLLEATIQAPTSFNTQHWRMVIFRDPELRKSAPCWKQLSRRRPVLIPSTGAW